MTTKSTKQRVFLSLLLTIRSFAQTVYKLEQKWNRSIKIGKKIRFRTKWAAMEERERRDQCRYGFLT
jgi:hypothetical protein